MKKILTLVLCILLLTLSGCEHYQLKATNNTEENKEAGSQSEENKEADSQSEDTDYQINYDASQFQMPDEEIYVSEMCFQKMDAEQILELWDIPKETQKTVEKDAQGYTYYNVNGNKYRLGEGVGNLSLYLENAGEESKIADGKIEEHAKKVFEKWEKSIGVELDINNIKALETSGDNGVDIQYDCSQLYNGIPCIGNANMDNPYVKTTITEINTDWRSVVSGSYCSANYNVDSSIFERFEAQRMLKEKKKIKLDKDMLTVDEIVDSMRNYVRSVKFAGNTYNVEEASVCYIPMPASSEEEVVNLTPCWKVLVTGKETFVENGQKTEQESSKYFYVDAVTGYVYDVNYANY